MSGANHSLVPPLPGVSMGYHGLSHHGKNPEMIRQLEVIERGTLAVWIAFIESLRDTPDGDGSLLDRSQVLLGSNLGNASRTGGRHFVSRTSPGMMTGSAPSSPKPRAWHRAP